MARTTKTPIDLNELVRLHTEGRNLSALALHFGCSIQSIGRRLTKLGIDYPKTNAKLVGRDDEVISAYLAGASSTDLGKQFNVSNVTIINMLKKHNVDRRSIHDSTMQYPYDETFFDVIDTEEKAYVLGLWYADGCNTDADHKIVLALTDEELVTRVARCFKTDKPIYRLERKIGKPIHSLVLNGLRVSQQLAEKGCGARKTYNLHFPASEIIPDGLLHHFVRGYFDGDGCIHNRKDSNNFVVHVLGTQSFIETLAEKAPVEMFTGKRTAKTVWYAGLYRKTDIVQFRDWMYADATIFLERKKEIFSTIQ